MKKNTSIILIGLLLTLSQLLLDTLNVAKFSTQTTVYIGALGILISIIRSGYIQYFDSGISNETLIIQVLLFILFVAGGVLDKLEILPFNEEWKSIIRLILTFIINAIPLILNTVKNLE